MYSAFLEGKWYRRTPESRLDRGHACYTEPSKKQGGQNALACYGNRAIDTPNLDLLAASSLKFNRVYTVSPWCLPARCSMLTGLYPHNSGAYSNFRKCALDEGLPNLFAALKEQGYRAALVGKCHFAPVPYAQTRPDRTLPYDDFRDYYLRLGMDPLVLQDDKQVSVWFYDDYSKELDEAGYLEAYRRDTWDITGKRKVFSFSRAARVASRFLGGQEVG